MAPISPWGVGSALVRQAIVLTFQNLRYLLDSCLPMLDKGFSLLDKGLLDVLTTNRSALSECALVCPIAGALLCYSSSGLIAASICAAVGFFQLVTTPVSRSMSRIT